MILTKNHDDTTENQFITSLAIPSQPDPIMTLILKFFLRSLNKISGDDKIYCSYKDLVYF